MPKKRGPSTTVGHIGRSPRKWMGAVNTPVFRASTILFPTVEELALAADRRHPGLTYGLHGLPTVADFQDAMAALEGGHAALAVPSGLTATTLPFLALLDPGDHALVTDVVYGPTRRFCDLHVKRLGVDVQYYDPLIGAGIAAHMKPNTRLVFLESPGSLTFEVQDVPAICSVARAHGARTVIDNTWATPLNFRAFDHGVDVSVHAATKYIGGHSDVLLGAIVANEETYKPLYRLWTDMGITASSDDCFLGLRGLRTLAARLERAEKSAMRIAQWLRDQPQVKEVLYPALPGARGHDVWKRDFRGASSLFGVILHPASEQRVTAMLDGMEIFAMGFSWGGFESLILPTFPERTRSVTTWSPGGPCLRLAVGLEDADDLIDDLAAGLSRLSQ
jgi:cystathionine beta-lyase